MLGLIDGLTLEQQVYGLWGLYIGTVIIIGAWGLYRRWSASCSARIVAIVSGICVTLTFWGLLSLPIFYVLVFAFVTSLAAHYVGLANYQVALKIREDRNCRKELSTLKPTRPTR